MFFRAFVSGAFLLLSLGSLDAQDFKPPALPGGKMVDSGTSPQLLKPISKLKPGTKIAKTAPVVDFAFYPGQTYPGRPWSVWGDSLAVGDLYYSSIGDHLSPEGNAYVYQYDSTKKTLKRIVDVRKTLNRPKGYYTPGKIHSRIDLGSDGWLYFSTHRGSTRVAFNPDFHYEGDWILRHHPQTGKTEIVAAQPLKMQSLPTGMLDPDRLIWYAGTQDGLNKAGPKFLAYDVRKRKVLYSDDKGPYRYLIFARSTGRVYFNGTQSSPNRTGEPDKLVRFDPEKPGKPVEIDARVGLRSATLETPQNIVYSVNGDNLWAFNTKTEKAEYLGPCVVGTKTYITSIDADMKTGRYLYFVAGAHGGSQDDGTPLVQYDVKTKTRKVIAFLHPYLYDRYGYVALGTFGSAVSPEGDKVYITWNGNYGTKREDLGRRLRFNACAMCVVHIPESERQP
ncbi:MAG: hypothetical protein KatS3mg105_1754 [Gemmatales bacterium]|nr:MAG: hypothetical protein KatS3mg105_1754 [Gemmatales bacterium]